eukprot:366147-Chlamydomonas_euryale.AAC.5
MRRLRRPFRHRAAAARLLRLGRLAASAASAAFAAATIPLLNALSRVVIHRPQVKRLNMYNTRAVRDKRGKLIREVRRRTGWIASRRE